MKQLKVTGKTKDWVQSVLANDENSSDDELVAYFMKEGKLPETTAKTLVSLRQTFMEGVFNPGSTDQKTVKEILSRIPQTTSKTQSGYWTPFGEVKVRRQKIWDVDSPKAQSNEYFNKLPKPIQDLRR